MSKTETARCYTSAFPYQHHFDGYVEMSEEDTAFFWEIDSSPTPNPEGDSAGLTSLAKAAMITEGTAPENVIPIRSVPIDKPNDPQCTDACARSSYDSQDTKPAESQLIGRIRREPYRMTSQPSGSRTLWSLMALKLMRRINPEQRLCWRKRLHSHQ